MLRSVLSAIAVAGILATAHPAFADPLAATPSDHTQAAAAMELPAPPAPVSPRSSDATAPASPGLETDVVPIGLGWG
jgi:hypothetical protein